MAGFSAWRLQPDEFVEKIGQSVAQPILVKTYT
jgi:hypothetical protein